MKVLSHRLLIVLLGSAPVREGKTLVTLLTAAQFVLLRVLNVETFSDATMLSSL